MEQSSQSLASGEEICLEQSVCSKLCCWTVEDEVVFGSRNATVCLGMCRLGFSRGAMYCICLCSKRCPSCFKLSD
jgi:hypothetical protein